MVKADLHIHTIVSDGALHPCDMVKYAAKLGLRVIAITDHNTFLGSLIGRRCARNVMVIYGAEVRSEVGDILLLCEHYLPNTPRSIKGVLDVKYRYNCLLIPAHPLSIVRNGMGLLASHLVKYWDGVEVFNAGSDPLTNLITYRLFSRYGIPLLSNSDAHVPEMLGYTYNIMSATPRNLEDALEIIRKGKVIPTYKVPPLRSQVRRFSWSLKRFIHKIPKEPWLSY